MSEGLRQKNTKENSAQTLLIAYVWEYESIAVLLVKSFRFIFSTCVIFADSVCDARETARSCYTLMTWRHLLPIGCTVTCPMTHALGHTFSQPDGCDGTCAMTHALGTP